MSKTRIKIKLPAIASRGDAEFVFGELALIFANRIKITAQMDAEIAAVRKRYEGNLAVMDEQLKNKSDALRAWAEANPDQFPKDRKSISFVHGVLGFRTGTPKVALLNRSWNWVKVLDCIQQFGFQFTRSTVEVDKESILAFAAEEQDKERLVERVLKPIGVKIVQDETFFVEPDITPFEKRQTVKVAA